MLHCGNEFPARDFTLNLLARLRISLAVFTKIGGEPYPGDRELVARLQKEETEAWKRYVKLAKIEPM